MADDVQPGRVVVRDVAGTSVIIMRNDREELRAYLNSCSHRGTELIERDGDIDSVLRCPYHRWGYDLDGKLKFLQKSLMEMVQNGQLTTAEKTPCLEQMDERAEAAPNDKAKKRIEENREALSKRSVLD